MKPIYVTRRNIVIGHNRSILGLGIFDGVHLGHQKIINEVIHQAKKHHLPPALLTFNPHPANVLNPKSPIKLLQTFKQRLQVLESFGIKHLFVIRFNREFAKLTHPVFVKKILARLINPQVIVIGKDFRFGKDTIGNASRLSTLAAGFGIKVITLAPYKKDGYKMSSSLIRRLLKSGKIGKANKFLGRPFSIEGKVIPGKKLGRKLGFPTLNISYDKSMILPIGIFSGRLLFKGKKYKAAVFIGFKSTLKLKLKKPVLEVNVLNFKRSLYGEKVEVFLLKKIRSERKFDTIESLRKAIKEDIKSLT